VKTTDLLELRELEIELVCAILSIPQGDFESFNTVVALNMIFKLANSPHMRLGLGTQLDEVGIQRMDIPFLHAIVF
jgi:hypothetical protein